MIEDATVCHGKADEADCADPLAFPCSRCGHHVLTERGADYDNLEIDEDWELGDAASWTPAGAP